MEKIDIVKRLIRSHNYQQTESVYLRCVELGIHVNKTALNRFAQKLALIDSAERQKNRKKLSDYGVEPQSQVFYSQSEPLEQQVSRPPVQSETPVTTAPMAPAPVNSISNQPVSQHNAATISYGEAKRRETEITFELGALKIKEHALLEELNALAQIINEKH